MFTINSCFSMEYLREYTSELKSNAQEFWHTANALTKTAVVLGAVGASSYILWSELRHRKKDTLIKELLEQENDTKSSIKKEATKPQKDVTKLQKDVMELQRVAKVVDDNIESVAKEVKELQRFKKAMDIVHYHLYGHLTQETLTDFASVDIGNRKNIPATEKQKFKKKYNLDLCKHMPLSELRSQHEKFETCMRNFTQAFEISYDCPPDVKRFRDGVKNKIEKSINAILEQKVSSRFQALEQTLFGLSYKDQPEQNYNIGYCADCFERTWNVQRIQKEEAVHV